MKLTDSSLLQETMKTYEDHNQMTPDAYSGEEECLEQGCSALGSALDRFSILL